MEGLRNPVDLWLAGGGRFNRKVRRRISAPSEVLPRWRAGIEAEVGNPMMRDAFRFGMFTGMRVDEVLCLRWERVDMARLVFRVDETKTGVPLELPITRQLAAIYRAPLGGKRGTRGRLGVSLVHQPHGPYPAPETILQADR